MIPTHAELIAPLRSVPAAGAILCDVDGTLAPIVDDPMAAAVPDETRAVLRALASAYRLVGCVSGRRATVAKLMVGVGDLYYVGNHGLELLAPGETEPRLDPALGRMAGAARAFVARLDPDDLEAIGVHVEDKGPIQALHWRTAPDQALAEQRLRELALMVERQDLVPHFGRKVLEVRPRLDVDKGTAVRALLGAREGVRTALYGGDDMTDLDAFAALRELVGEQELSAAVCIGVDSGEAPGGLASESDALVDGPDGFRAVLDALAPGPR